jgi:hypothetical protein
MFHQPTRNAIKKNKAAGASRLGKQQAHIDSRSETSDGVHPGKRSNFGQTSGDRVHPDHTPMQQTIGNQAILRMLSRSGPALQPKLTINQAGDQYEQEADRVADHVMRMPEPADAPAIDPAPREESRIQRKCSGCEDEEKLQRKEVSSGSAVAPSLAPPLVPQVLSSPGKPLDTVTRTFFEPRFGHDFSDVRIHTDSHAEESALSIRARAYTAGRHIVFGRGAYSSNQGGRQLMAHELVHVIQQQGGAPQPRAAGQTAGDLNPNGTSRRPDVQRRNNSDAKANSGLSPMIAPSLPDRVARAPLDVDTISQDAKTFASFSVIPGQLIGPLFIKYRGPHPQGEVAWAANYPTTFTLPTDKTKRVKAPKADTTPPLSNIPVTGHFFPAIWPSVTERAVVLGGFHGDEHPGWEVADELVKRLSAWSLNLAFHTIVIPRVNAGAIEDELAGVRMWRNRCNRQLVDLNRNFPTGNTPRDTDCANTVGAPIQPEVQGVMDVIKKFNPHRILSTHAISTPAEAGVFADPSKDQAAIDLARGMASTLASKADRPANKGLAPTTFDAVYPLDRGKTTPSAGTSLGTWGPTAVDPAHPIPVITMEAPGFSSLSSGAGSEARSLNDFVRPVEAFLSDPTRLAAAADQFILNDIDAMPPADLLAFLTGTLRPSHPIYPRIAERIDAAIAKLKAAGPPPPGLTTASELRLFGERSATGDTPQAQIVFDKFFLLGNQPRTWDTFPARFRDKKGVPDRPLWLAASTKERLNTILQFSALPGASRHHWGTEVDFNSVNVADWRPPSGTLVNLGQWLQKNAPKLGFIQAYTAGRSGGYNEEPWHYSYAPLSVGLRQRYSKLVNIQTDVIDQIDKEFQKRAKAASQTVPPDFKTELQNINIADLVNNLGPGL